MRANRGKNKIGQIFALKIANGRVFSMRVTLISSTLDGWDLMIKKNGLINHGLSVLTDSVFTLCHGLMKNQF